MKKSTLFFVTVPLVLASCGPPIAELPELTGVNTIYITVHGDGFRPIAHISDPSRVAEIVEFVNTRRTGWTEPWYGVPVPAVEAQFCEGHDFKGHFGAGPNFFETNRGCTFCSRSASPSEVMTFLELLQVDARFLDWDFNGSDAQDGAGKSSQKSPPEVCGQPL